MRLTKCQEPTRYRLMTRLQFTYPGMGRNAGYLLIDTFNGYRCNYKKTSFLATVK